MAGNSQKAFGFLNTQHIDNHNIVVDKEYLKHLLSMPNNPSDINQVILYMFNSIIDVSTDDVTRGVPPEIEEKISFNNVITYADIIRTNYSENGFFVEEAYKSLDSETPGRKKTFLSYINHLYLTSLGEYKKKTGITDKPELIKNYADDIITDVVNRILIKINANNRGIEHISGEVIELNVLNIICYAFVDCKVLENPNLA